MAVTSEIISQAKWSWFWSSRSKPARRGRPLSGLQTFDKASRGPLGSLLLIGTGLRNPVLLMSLIAVLLSIAMGPFSQQAVRTIDCTYVDPTQTAFIPNVQTVGYSNLEVSYPVKGAIISSLTDPNSSDSRIQPTCTSGNCTFRSFQDQEGVQRLPTEEEGVLHYADEPPGGNISTDYWTLPHGQTVSYEERGWWATQYNITFIDIRAGYWSTDDTVMYNTDMSSAMNLSWATESLGPEFLNLSAFSLLNITILMAPGAGNQTVPRVAFACTLYPCVQSYFASVSNGELEESVVSTQTLLPWGKDVPDLGFGDVYQEESHEIAIFPADMISIQTPCLVERSLYTQENISSAPEATTLPRRRFNRTTPIRFPFYNGQEDEYKDLGDMVNVKAPTPCLYGMDHYRWFEDMQEFAESTFSGACTLQYGGELRYPDSSCDPFWIKPVYQSGSTLSAVDAYMSTFTQSITRKFHLGIDRGESTTPDYRGESATPDDYGSSMSGVNGSAWQTTTCFAVDWRWLLLPSALTLFTALALTWTLVKPLLGVRDESMLWKSSILPLLYYKERVVPTADDRGVYRFAPAGTGDLLDLGELNKDAKRARVTFQGTC
ncbi:Uu.00g007420.m01.CDS01 [Anthostomella pinea]|uniref:Uu.00g007420.m01.CDS01 n=1 Tax=Anthostomella pinea TaxID=933095 RepID=A0AAI8VX15_9PEZI|nr:Uu.00g007420.m01.CDS01 [Anthostomella pinea]